MTRIAISVRAVLYFSKSFSKFRELICLALFALVPISSAFAAQPIANPVNIKALYGSQIVIDMNPYVYDADHEKDPLKHFLSIDIDTAFSPVIDQENLLVYLNTGLLELDTKGQVFIPYTVWDSIENSAESNITLSLYFDQTPPANLSFYAVEDTPVTVNLKPYFDYNKFVYPKSLFLETPPSLGELTIVNNTTLSYIPKSNVNGTDMFSVVFLDSAGAKQIITVMIYIAPVNDAPVLANHNSSTVLNIGSGPHKIDIKPYISDVDAGDSHSISQVIQGRNLPIGVVSFAGTTMTYTPPSSGSGTVSLSYTVQDLAGATSNLAVYTLTLNGAPSATNTTRFTKSGTSLDIHLLNEKLINDDGGAVNLNVSLIGADNNGVAVVSGGSATVFEHVITFVPGTDFGGTGSTASIGYTVTDQYGLTATGNISVFRTNTLPTANSFTVQTKKTTALDIDLKTLGAVSDPDFGDGLDYSVPSTIEGGSLTGTETPYIFTFTPDASFNGTSFVYTVTDQFGDNIAVEATATINLENTPPTANDINLATTGDQTVLIDVSEVISDPDEGNDSLFVVFNSNSLSVSGGDLVKGELPNHQIEFTPDPASFTTTSFSYSVTDSTGAWDTGTITISRNNSPPLALDVPVTPVLPWNQSREININEFISDPDEADSTLSFNPQPVTPIEAGSYEIATAKHGIVFTPTVGYSGLASIPYSVSDSGGSTSATRHITINIVAPANDSPVAKDVVLATKGNTSLRINLLTLDAISDPNQSADSLDVTFPQAVPGGTLSQEEVPYIVVFRPNEAFATSTNFNYTVIDQGGLEAVGTITINRENTAPTAENAVITPDMNWNVTRSVNLMNYITDADQQKSTLKIAIGEISPANAGDISRDDTRDPVYLYLPAEGFVGAATLSYTVTDDQEAQTQGTITWNVVAPQNTTLPSELTPPEYEGGAPLVLDLRDYAPQISSVPGLQVSIPQAPQHGTASIEQLTVTYIPDQTYSGADSFEILIANNLGFNSKMRVSTELVATNEKPSEAPGGPLVAFDITQGKLQQNSSLGSTSVPLGFVLKDQLGNPINGATVVWSMSSSNPDSIPSDGKARAIIVGGTPDVTDTTGADGASAVTITAGAVPEILTVSAQATGTLGVDPFDETLSFTISVGLKAIVSEDTPEGAVAKVIDTMCPSLAKTADRNADEEALNTLCDNIISDSASGNNAAAQQALKAIAPEEVAQQTRMAQSIAGQQLGNIGTRLSALRRGISGVAVSDFSFRMQGQSVPSSVFYDLLPSYLDQELKNNPRLGGFISGSLGKGSYDAFKNEDSFEFKTKGITAGVDYRYNRQFVLGGALGYSNTDLELGTSSGDINANGLNLALYSTYYHKDSFYVDGIFTLGNTSYDMNRNIVFSSGSTLYNRTANGQTESALYVLSLGAGYELASESGWVLGFNGRFNTVRVHIDAYDESGAQELNMSISSQAIDLYSSSLGGNISKALSFRWGVMVPQISGSYEHEFQADVGTVQGSFVNDRFNTSFAFETEEIDNNYFRVGVGSTFVLPKGRTGFVQYERTVFRYRYNDYRIAVGGRLEF